MKQYYQVNWVNGMKITSDHFIELENHFVYRMQQSLKGLVTEFSYGLLPSGDAEPQLPKFSISLNDNRIKTLTGFAMVSVDGDFIQVPANVEFKLLRPADEATRYYLVITGDSLSRMRIGQVNELESPLRSPYTMPEYVFQFIPVNGAPLHALGRSIVPVGKYSGGAFDEDITYITPCTSMKSHPSLSRLAEDIISRLVELTKKVEELRKKTNVTNKDMLHELVRFFNMNLTSALWYNSYQPPVFLIEKVHQVARIFHFAIITNNLQVREEHARLLKEFVDFQYNHLELGPAVEIVRKFINNFQVYLPKDDTSFGV